MPAPVRPNPLYKGKDLVFYVKKPGATDFVLYGCMTSGNFNNPGVELEDIACRETTYKAPSGDPGIPTLSLESLIRQYPTGEAATHVTDNEIKKWVKEGTIVVGKFGGIYAGDEVETGPGVFNAQTLNGPQSGTATGGVTFNWTEMPVTSTVA
jgi:hypothetical protein